MQMWSVNVAWRIHDRSLANAATIPATFTGWAEVQIGNRYDVLLPVTATSSVVKARQAQKQLSYGELITYNMASMCCCCCCLHDVTDGDVDAWNRIITRSDDDIRLLLEEHTAIVIAALDYRVMRNRSIYSRLTTHYELPATHKAFPCIRISA